MTYRTDPYWRLYGSGAKEPQQGFQTNAKFYRPSKRIRFLEAQKQLDGGLQNYELKRGYLRGLPQPGIHSADFRPMKLGFQFNPQQIRQSVQMREDVYLPIMQDPTQFTQPFAGSVNFGFDLLFDRSAEVATATTSDMAATFREADLENPDYKSDAADIGVLSDLQVLYAIIGQGFSAELLEFQAERLKQSAAYLITEETDTGITADNIDEKARNFVNDMNLGNAAFLIPNPVRLIFSSLFMVDGFVTGTNVDFLKFNTAMVPIQARVTIDMNAIYIGFAREKTFLTAQLEEAAKIIEQEKQEEIAAEIELVKILKDNVKYFAYVLGEVDTEFNGTIEAPNTSGDSRLYLFIAKPVTSTNELGNTTGRINWLGYHAIRAGWLNKDNDASLDTLTVIAEATGSAYGGQKTATEYEKITDLVTISYTLYINIYGPYDTEAEATYARTANDYGTGKHVGQYAISASTQTGEWDDSQSTFKGEPEFSAANNTAPDAPTYEDLDAEETFYADSYYSVRFTVVIRGSGVGSESTISKQVTSEKTYQGHNVLVYNKLTIPWDDPYSTPDGSGGSTRY